MQDVNREVKQRFPGRLMIAEDLQKDEALTRPVEAGGAGFDAQWAAAFVHPVRAALIPEDDAARDLDAVVHALTQRYHEDAFERVIYTESHDEVANGKARLASEIDPADPRSWAAQKRTTLGAALVFTSPGIPMLFQGQEFLEDEWFRDTDPVDWTKLRALRGLRTLYRDLIALRRGGQGRTRGLTGQHIAVLHVDSDNRLLAFHRWDQGGPGDDTVVVANLGGRAHAVYELPFPRPGRWHLLLNTDWDGYSPLFSGHPASDTDVPGDTHRAVLSIGPYTVLIFSQAPQG
jgi:1,4-alpha-glucan branching enzyme